MPALGVPSGLRCPVHAGAPGGASRTRTEGSRSSARCPHGPSWRRAQPLPGRPGVYPRSRQQGAPFRFGSRGCGGRRCAAPRCAPARTGPGPLDAASPLLLPAGRAPAAGERGAAGAAARGPSGPGGAAGRARAGKAGGRWGPPAPPPPLSPGSGGPDSRLRSPAARRGSAPRNGERTGRGGEGSSGPFGRLRGARRQGRVALGLGGRAELRAWGSPGGSELPGGGCSLRDTGFSGAGPGPPDRASEGGSERSSGEGEHLHRALYPSQRPSPFHCQAD